MIKKLLLKIIPLILFFSLFPKSPLFAETLENVSNQAEITNLDSQPNQPTPLPPTLVSPKYILINLKDDRVLLEQNADERTEIASLTKIMTAILTLENLENLDEKLTITNEMLTGLAEFAIIGLQPGQTISIEELLYALLLPSAGDAGQALAIRISNSIPEFANLMNNKAAELNLKNTTFSNPVGKDDNNFSTARDISALLKYALKDEKFREIFTTTEKFLPSLNKTVVKTTTETAKANYFDDTLITGSKTGYTNAAGRCLASISDQNETELLLVNLNAPVNTADHVNDAINLYAFYKNNYSYRKIKSTGDTLIELKVKDSKQKSLKISATEDITYYLENNLDLSTLTEEYDGINEIPRGTKEGDFLGTYRIKNGDSVLYETTIYLTEKINFYPYELWTAIAIGIFLAVVTLFIILKKRSR